MNSENQVCGMAETPDYQEQMARRIAVRKAYLNGLREGEELGNKTFFDLAEVLAHFCGEAGHEEGPLATLKRIVKEREYLAKQLAQLFYAWSKPEWKKGLTIKEAWGNAYTFLEDNKHLLPLYRSVVPPVELDRTCREGERVCWRTISGDEFEGLLEEWDSNVAIVRLDDGTEKGVEC